MSDIDYAKLNRLQKLAVLLITLGPEPAAEILKHFDDTDIEHLCREMSALPIVPAEVQRQALDEFSEVIARGASSAIGGLPYAQRTVELAKGDFKATSIIGRAGPTGDTTDVIKEIGEMEGRQIFNLLKHEQPQTLAFVLSYLESEKASEVFRLLTPEMREEVAERLGTIESTSVELVAKIVRSLGRHLDTRNRPAFHHSGGVRAVADLLNSLDKEASKGLLARLEERNANFGTQVRKKMFSFEDLSRLQATDLQRVMREVESSALAVAMKSASEPLREKIFAAVSKRAAESLRDEISLLGPVRLKDVENAQDGIIQVVRRLEEEGQISLDLDAEQAVVV